MFAFDTLVSKIKDVAPILGSAISSINPAAGIAISLVSSAFGVDSKDHKSLLDKINSDPEAILKLKKIEFDHEETLLKISSDDFAREVEDRKSARDMQIQAHSFIPTFLAIGYFVTYSALQFYCLMYPAQANELISARLHDGFMLVLAYFFGASHEKFTKK